MKIFKVGSNVLLPENVKSWIEKDLEERLEKYYDWEAVSVYITEYHPPIGKSIEVIARDILYKVLKFFNFLELKVKGIGKSAPKKELLKFDYFQRMKNFYGEKVPQEYETGFKFTQNYFKRFIVKGRIKRLEEKLNLLKNENKDR